MQFKKIFFATVVAMLFVSFAKAQTQTIPVLFYQKDTLFAQSVDTIVDMYKVIVTIDSTGRRKVSTLTYPYMIKTQKVVPGFVPVRADSAMIADAARKGGLEKYVTPNWWVRNSTLLIMSFILLLIIFWTPLRRLIEETLSGHRSSRRDDRNLKKRFLCSADQSALVEAVTMTGGEVFEEVRGIFFWRRKTTRIKVYAPKGPRSVSTTKIFFSIGEKKEGGEVKS
jgi:hypothetical protein